MNAAVRGVVPQAQRALVSNGNQQGVVGVGSHACRQALSGGPPQRPLQGFKHWQRVQQGERGQVPRINDLVPRDRDALAAVDTKHDARDGTQVAHQLVVNDVGGAFAFLAVRRRGGVQLPRAQPAFVVGTDDQQMGAVQGMEIDTAHGHIVTPAQAMRAKAARQIPHLGATIKDGE